MGVFWLQGIEDPLSQWRDRSGFTPDYLHLGTCVPTNNSTAGLVLSRQRRRGARADENAGVPRLFLVCHASTDAQRHVRFPSGETLSDRGLREAARIVPPVVDRVLTAPERRAVATAGALGTGATVDPALRDLDHGTWRGLRMDEVPEPDLMRWLTDPDAAPHGGESITALLARVGAWLARLDAPDPQRIAAVTHPAVIRAAITHALSAPPSAFWRIDVRPVSVTRLHGSGGRWTLRLG